MGIEDLLVLYAIAGLASAYAVWRAWPRRGAAALGAAAIAVPFWPLWAPIVLTRAPPARRPTAGATAPDATVRIDAALDEALAAAAGSPLGALLSADAARRIRAQVAAAAARHAELDHLLRGHGFDPEAAARRIAELERTGGSPRAITTARTHLANVERLVALRDRDLHALAELEDAIAALRTQIVLARYAGSSLEGVGAIVADVWARVEGLGAVIEAEPPRSHPE
jgi:hypothetical protein